MEQTHDDLPVPPQDQPKADIVKITKSFENGSKWFYWIAGLSLVNSVAHLAHANFSFVIGLGITQIVDAIALAGTQRHPEISVVINIIAFIFAAIFAGIFALFGWLAGRKHGWAFIVGLILYVPDGLIFLLIQDWMSIAFHGFAFVCILTGYTNLRKLNQLQAFAVQQQPVVIPGLENSSN
jgi:hypothetical protein